MTSPHRRVAVLGGLAALAGVAMLATGCAAPQRAREDDSPTHRALTRLPRRSKEARVAVAIYEVTSALPELPPRGSTEMFKTALVKSGRFRVLDRSRLAGSVMVEKQLASSGQTRGRASEQALHGAEYLFQAEVTEVNAGAGNSATSVGVGGLVLGGATNRDELGLDIHIVDAATGEVVDAVNVRKRLTGSAVQVSGVAALANTVMATRGKTASAYTPDVQHSSSRKQSLDAALREAIEEGVRLLAARFEG
jgi:curli biogenesis system outer membrane secretion channel CsgG